MLISFLRGVGLIFTYLLPFTHKMPYRYRSLHQGAEGDWKRIGQDLRVVLESHSTKAKQIDHKG